MTDPGAASAARDAFIRESLVPYFRHHLGKRGLRSALLLVAQFWADEADDAVHYEILWSKLDSPDVPSGLAALDAYEDGTDDVNLDSQPQGTSLVADFHAPNDEDRGFIPGWDENLGMIPLFAQYCLEDCDQEMAPSEAYSPCLLFRLDGDDLTYELVGENRRPWLEGVRPQWADDADMDVEDLPDWIAPKAREPLPKARLRGPTAPRRIARLGALATAVALFVLVLRACLL